MILRQLVHYSLILVTAFLLAITWEFIFEPLIEPMLFGEGQYEEDENDAERWEYVLTVTAFVFLAIQLPFGLSVRAAKQQQRNEQSLRQAAAVYDYMIEAVMITEIKGIITATNPAFSTLTGYQEKEVIGKPPTLLNAEYKDPKEYLETLNEINLTGYWRSEHMYRNKLGVQFPVKEQVSLIKDNKGDITNYIYIFSDISEIKSSWSQLEYQAQHDPLTGLPNRLLLDASIEQSIKRARREDQMIAIIYLDIDHFKTINDSLGHRAGDRLLQQLANRLPELLREQDITARLGGDEFVILLEELDSMETILSVIEKIHSGLEQPWQIDDHHLSATASMGISIYPENGETSKILIQKADLAMYSAKKAGRNRYHLFEEHEHPDTLANTFKRAKH